ncbi:aromatic prenyltransferase [Hypoxylon trugodes]|uniref:aromatic prenyltransferase n=1 Tax=Hypoxylon trugodes TaxID=326681 RepID=UPI00219698E1|nr:aromatic prenyltransferase [Hypoxylon trugodes]KAI1386228.1 aromatic prenyltransferase [Hypoxylon trugodes]
MSKVLRSRRDLGVTCYPPILPASLVPVSLKLILESLFYNTKFLFPEEPKTAFQQVTSAIQNRIDRHERYWWEKSGHALAVLLQNAGYTHAAQVNILQFFAREIASNLGTANEPGARRWKSFMTDDNNPIELSWDWHTGVEKPTIRFSIEPIGLDAGSPYDLCNEYAAEDFKHLILKALPDTDMSWFDHFEGFFSDKADRNSVEGHPSRVFWAFDLGEKEIQSKAYFFPGYRARTMNQTNLQVISEAIASAPSCTPEKLGAFNQFAEFVNEHEQKGGLPLELDMLAIDMIDSAKSRLKIYFRNRQTDFRSVRETMTLGGRVTGDDMDAGLSQLRRLWNSLFDQEGKPEDTAIGQADHRTSGILYNVEFRLGGQSPKAKIYIPVRHYARSDAQVARSVSQFMDSQRREKLQDQKSELAGGERAISPVSAAYGNALNTIFTDDSMATSRGLHTYVACSVQAGGALRVVSYINPQEKKLRQTSQKSLW